MSDEELLEEAGRICSLLPKVMRGLFSIEDDESAMVLPAAQLRVCSILYEGARTMSSLRKELRISLSAITQIADRLEKAGLVERVSEPDDRRVRSLQLTPLGVGTMQSRLDKRRRRVLDTIQRLDPESRETVMRALNILLSAGLASAEEFELDEADNLDK